MTQRDSRQSFSNKLLRSLPHLLTGSPEGKLTAAGFIESVADFRVLRTQNSQFYGLVFSVKHSLVN